MGVTDVIFLSCQTNYVCCPFISQHSKLLELLSNCVTFDSPPVWCHLKQTFCVLGEWEVEVSVRVAVISGSSLAGESFRGSVALI